MTLFSQNQQLIDDFNNKALESIKLGNKNQASGYYNKIAFTYWDTKQFEPAIDFFSKSLEINEDIKNYNAQITIIQNIASIYSEIGNYNNAIQYFNKSLYIAKQINDKNSIYTSLNNIALVNNNFKKFQESINYANDALTVALELNNKKYIKNCYSLIAQNYDAMGNNQKYFEYYKLFVLIDKEYSKEELKKIESENSEKMNIAQQKSLQYEYEKKQKELELILQQTKLLSTEKILSQTQKISDKQKLEIGILLKDKVLKEQEIRNRELLNMLFFTFFVFFILIISLIFYYFRKNKRKNKELTAKNIEIENQRDDLIFQKMQIEEQNNEIIKINSLLKNTYNILELKNEQHLSSLRYAQKIQTSLLPSIDELKQTFSDAFIIYKPKEVVSGDFYWCNKADNKIFFAVADCTGHGVPGALMSMIGNAILNQLLFERKIYEPSLILEKLHKLIKIYLKQDDENLDILDGMDIALFSLDLNENILKYSGAKRPLLLWDFETLKSINADNFSIGGFPLNLERKFTTQTLSINKNQVVYLFSDGFIDQINESGKRFGIKNFIKLLEKNVSFELNIQKENIINEFINFKNEEIQIDDILIVALKF